MVVLISWVTALITLFADVKLPSVYADWLFYIIPTALIASFCSLRTTTISTVVFSIFTIIGFFLSPPEIIPISLSIFNRILGIIVLWFIAFLSATLRLIRLQTEKKEKLFHTLADNIPQLVWVADAKGKMFWFNKQFFEYTGTTPQKMEKSGIREVLHPEHASQIEQFISHAMDLGEPWQDTFLIRRSDGEYHWFLSKAIPIRDDKGRIERWFGTNTDVNDSKRTEEHLRDERNYINAIIEVQGALVITLDKDFKIQCFNHACEDVTRYSREKVVGNFFWDLMIDEDKDGIKNQLTTITQKQNPPETESYIRVKDNGTRFIRWRITVLRNPNGEIQHFVIAGIDLTDRIKTEKDIRRLNSELLVRASEFENANKELESFSYSVSHDLRTPLRTIMGFAQILSEDYYENLDDVGKDYLRRIYFSSKEMDNLISDILRLSRVSRQEMIKEKVDLSLISLDVLEELRASESERVVEASVEQGCKVVGDPNLLKIALTNLIGNAWKYTKKKEDPTIEFGSEKIDNRCRYYVRDNGVGFDMSSAAEVFLPFRRLHSESEFPGTGVGLAIVEKIIKKHGGKIWAESQPGRGATFYFTISEE